MDIYLKEAANKKSSLRFPSLPDKEIVIKRATKYHKYDIIRKGTFVFPSGPDVKSYSWNGYFWGSHSKKSKSINRKWINPESCIKKLESWRDKGTILNLIISGGGVNVDVTIQNFEYKRFGGNGDYSYSITFYLYRPLKIQTTKDLGIDNKKKKTTVRADLKKVESDKKKETYPVTTGDNLWTIARKFYGGSGSDWIKIYEANKTIIENAAKKYGHKDSNNGDLIFPGTILTIP